MFQGIRDKAHYIDLTFRRNYLQNIPLGQLINSLMLLLCNCLSIWLDLYSYMINKVVSIKLGINNHKEILIMLTLDVILNNNHEETVTDQFSNKFNVCTKI